MTTSAAWQAVVGSVDDVAAAVRAEQLLMLEHHPDPAAPYVRALRALAISRRNWRLQFEPRAARIIDGHGTPRAYIAFDEHLNIDWAQGGGQVISAAALAAGPADMWLHVWGWLRDMPAKAK